MCQASLEMKDNLSRRCSFVHFCRYHERLARVCDESGKVLTGMVLENSARQITPRAETLSTVVDMA